MCDKVIGLEGFTNGFYTDLMFILWGFVILGSGLYTAVLHEHVHIIVKELETNPFMSKSIPLRLIMQLPVNNKVLRTMYFTFLVRSECPVNDHSPHAAVKCWSKQKTVK